MWVIISIRHHSNNECMTGADTLCHFVFRIHHAPDSKHPNLSGALSARSCVHSLENIVKESWQRHLPQSVRARALGRHATVKE